MAKIGTACTTASPCVPGADTCTADSGSLCACATGFLPNSDNTACCEYTPPTEMVWAFTDNDNFTRPPAVQFSWTVSQGILQNYSRYPPGLLTLTHPVKLVPRENRGVYTPWPPSIHLHWWQAHHACNLHFAEDIDATGGSDGELPGLMQQSHRESDIVWSGCRHRTEQHHDEQHEQY